MSDPNMTTPDQPQGPFTPVPGEAVPAEGTVVEQESPDVSYEELPQVEGEAVEATVEEAPSEETPARKEVTADVVSALLQGKYSTDAAEQRRRLAAEGYDPEEVAEAVRERLNQRYE